MAGVNKVILVGNVGGDPEIRHMPSGDAVANVSLATSEGWKDRNTGEKKERTEWHRVVFFGKLAEIVEKHVRKGSKLYVEGKLRTRKYDKDGQTHYSTEVVIDMGGTMQMLDSRQDGAQSGPGGQGRSSGRQDARDAHSASQAAQAPSGGGPADYDDEIPFAAYQRGWVV